MIKRGLDRLRELRAYYWLPAAARVDQMADAGGLPALDPGPDTCVVAGGFPRRPRPLSNAGFGIDGRTPASTHSSSTRGRRSAATDARSGP